MEQLFLHEAFKYCWSQPMTASLFFSLQYYFKHFPQTGTQNCPSEIKYSTLIYPFLTGLFPTCISLHCHQWSYKVYTVLSLKMESMAQSSFSDQGEFPSLSPPHLSASRFFPPLKIMAPAQELSLRRASEPSSQYWVQILDSVTEHISTTCLQSDCRSRQWK